MKNVIADIYGVIIEQNKVVATGDKELLVLLKACVTDLAIAAGMDNKVKEFVLRDTGAACKIKDYLDKELQ